MINNYFKKDKFKKVLLFLFGMICSAFFASSLAVINVVYFEYDKDGYCVCDACVTSDLKCVERIIEKEGNFREADSVEFSCEDGPCYKTRDPYTECVIDKKLRNRVNEVIIFWSTIISFTFGPAIGVWFVKLRKK